MANFRYISLRAVRHFMPDSLARVFLLNHFIISPSLETSLPSSAVEQYNATLNEEGESIKGKRVMVFGYGGKPEIGRAFLESGAREVLLVERPGLALEPFEDIDSQKIFRLHRDIRALGDQEIPPADVVVSHSVFEHLDDPEGLAASLARLTVPGGCHIHFIDLRDHYFKYPFEMLKYSESVWKTWLNPTSNLNRLRFFDYERIFTENFKEAKIQVLDRDIKNFRLAKLKILPQFLSGDEKKDAVTLIRVFARR